MGVSSLIVGPAIVMCFVSIVVWGAPDLPAKTLSLTNKSDEVGYHVTCYASKHAYQAAFRWEHNAEDCSKSGRSAKFSPLVEDKYNKIVNSEIEDEVTSTLTQVGSTGEDSGPQHCVCCVIETHSMCINLTMQHEHHHHHHR